MPYKHGTYGVINPSIAKLSEIVDTTPVYFGIAPINLVRGEARETAVNRPVRIRNMAEAKELLGYSGDWSRYTLCEAMALHFNNPLGNVGPIYCLNVLDLAKHKGDQPVAATLAFSNGKAEYAGTDIILDSIRLERPVPEGPKQTVAFRDKGAGKGDKGFDYAKAYAAAGIKLQDGVLTYEPTGVIDEKLLHDGKLYVGLTFTKPGAATHVTVKMNGQVVDDNLDLSKDGDFVLNGQLVEYVAVAEADGTPLHDRALAFECEWTGGDTEETVCMVSTGEGRYYEENVDYTLSYNYDRSAAIFTDVQDALPETVRMTCDTVDPSKVTVAELIGEKTTNGAYSGIAALDLLFMEDGTIPNILAAPGFSDIPEVGKALTNATRHANGHWDSMAMLDLPIVDEEQKPLDTTDKIIKWKAKNHYNDERTKACWPRAIDSNTGNVVHLSTLCVVEQVRADQSHSGIPMETCSNKPVPIRRQYFGETSPNMGFGEAEGNILNEAGITTLKPWASTWVIWGPHTAAYTYGDRDLDARAIFDVTIRMLMHITNSFQLDWAMTVDQPFNRALRDTILNVEREKLDRLVSMGALLGTPTVEFTEEDNTNDDMLQGDFTWSIETTPTPPAKSLTVVVAYTDEGFSVLLGGE